MGAGRSRAGHDLVVVEVPAANPGKKDLTTESKRGRRGGEPPYIHGSAGGGGEKVTVTRCTIHS